MERRCTVLRFGALSLVAACNYPVEVAEHWGDLRRSGPAAPLSAEAAASPGADAGTHPEAEVPGLPTNSVPQVDVIQHGQGPKPPGDAAANGTQGGCEYFERGDEVNYGYDCHASADTASMYRCSCREDGFPKVSFSVAHACPAPLPTDHLVAARLASLRCNWDFEYEPALTASCESFEGVSDSGECVYTARCEGQDYGLECFENEHGVRCVCQVGGEAVSELQLDGLGCALGSGRPSEDAERNGAQQAQRSLNLICGWALD